MDYDAIINDESFFKWDKYAPLDVQYFKYAESNPSIIAAGHKIYDVFIGFYNARASLMFADSKDFGDMAGDSDASRLYTKCHLLQNALIEYAICLDLSWQVVWAYIQPSSLEYLMEQKYKDMEKECSRDSVLAQLNCIVAQNGYGVSEAQAILDTIKNFDNDETTLKLRSIYNKIKHQGTIYYEGLGANFDHLSIAIDGKALQMLHRDSYGVDEIKDLLYSYHVSFQKYMNNLIQIIMPDGYLDSEMNLVDALNAAMKMFNEEKKHNIGKKNDSE